MAITINASTSTGLVQSADTSGTVEIQSNGTTKFTVATTGAYGQLVSDTAKSATSTSVDFTGIPSWVKRITVMLSGVSTNGSTNLLIQIGAGSVTSSGYASSSGIISGTNTTVIATSTAGFIIRDSQNSARVTSGIMFLTNITGNTWVSSHSIGDQTQAIVANGGGSIALSGTLDRVRITTTNGTDAFDAGTINILYEG